MNYEAPVMELIYFRSEDILVASDLDDVISGRNFTDEMAEM